MKDWTGMASELSKTLAQIRAGAPDALKGFSALTQGATKAGEIDGKTKELIAMALGIAARCDGCLAFHAKTLVDLKATRGEIMEDHR